MKTKVNPLYLYCPIERVDDDKREITAYAFTQEVVDGEGGTRLKRSAMEAATPDYMQWANVRRMHQPDAVAVAASVDWDQKGALMVVRVEDDDAWSKVKAGVYKGLSVGVRPTMMRGKDVESCVWFETSLVDRPKDPGAKFLALRADGVEDDDCEIEEDDGSELVRGAFADYVKNYESSRLRSFAIDALQSVLWDIQNGQAANKGQLVREACSELANYLAPIIDRGEFEDPQVEVAVTRIEDGEAVYRVSDIDDKDQTISRLTQEAGEQAETIERVEGENAFLRAEVETLKKAPAQQPVYRGGFVAVDKDFATKFKSDYETGRDEKEKELQRLQTAPLDADDPEGMRRSKEISTLKLELQRL
ncbi:MAG: hypothetical protein JST51_11725 [Armatimonadetes bacterium]|nr:hypothetical protein [Armatimonadota bacterium]